MRLVAASIGALALAGCVLPMGIPGMGTAGIATNPAEAQAAAAALQQAQMVGAAQATRPGDAAMDCPALQAEMMASMQDPKFKQAMASMGATAKDEQAKIDAAMAGKTGPGATPNPDAPLSMTANLTTMMPQIMRSQRLNELATAKKCAFLQGMTTN